MDSSFFTSKMQEIFYSLLLRMMEKAGWTDGATNPSAAPAPSTTLGGTPTSFNSLIREASAKYSVDPSLVKAVITANPTSSPRWCRARGRSG